MAQGFQRLPVPAVVDPTTRSAISRIIDWVFRVVMQGKLNCVGTITLTINSATTAMSDPRLGGESWIGFMPTTANAAAAIGGLFVTAQGNGTATLNHANNAQADRTFTYAILG